MKFPLLPKRENYINIVVTIFSLIVLGLIFFRIPIDKANTAVAVFFENDSRVLFYTGKENISNDVQLIIPMKGIKETTEDFYKKVNGRYVGNLEFYGEENFIKEFYKTTKYKNIVKVHYIKPEEITKYNAYTLFKRFWRAVVERSVEVIVIPYSKTSIDAFDMFKNFFQVSTTIPKPDNTDWNNKIFGLLLGVFVSLQMPLAIIFFLFFKSYWLYVSMFSILGTIVCYYSTKDKFTKIVNFVILGTLTNFSLYSFDYLNDLETYRGVKLSLILLPITVFLIEFTKLRREQLVTRKQMFVFSIIALPVVVYVILRSGNYGFVTAFEEKVRMTLENIFIIRPRIKELIFLPMLLLATDLENPFINSVFAFFGTLGLVSTFNSFCHIKAPIYVVFYRELITVIIAVATYFLILTFKNLIKIWTGRA
ncbi:MAG: DUF5693 family protein [Fervidobacterium sp.]